ncbi:MAG TPA: hypothetical protein VFK05_03445 [Polyangiaceae bacterium]|nr:hypothetical protein [Polyangiaceae bacterium]
MSISVDPVFSEPHIKGAIILPARDWMIKTYGVPTYERALAAIGKDAAEMVRGKIVSVGWYPLQAWTAFTAAMRREVLASTGEDGKTFDRRIVFEPTRETLLKIYRFVLSLFEVSSATEKLVPVMNRVYSHGKIDMVSHVPGEIVMLFHDGPVSMQDEIQRQFPLACEFMLHLAGQQTTEMRPLLKTQGGKISLELHIKYRKAR